MDPPNKRNLCKDGHLPPWLFGASSCPLSPLATHRLLVEKQLQHRNSISCRLPGACAGAGQEVLPLQRQRYGLFLDQRRSRPAQVSDSLRRERTGLRRRGVRRHPRSQLHNRPHTCRSRGSSPMCSNPSASWSSMACLRTDSAHA